MKPTVTSKLTEPLSIYSLPCFVMVMVMFVASLEAMSGSVMRKADLILPSNNGASHSLFCASFPYFAKTSIFPVSGAAQLVACGFPQYTNSAAMSYNGHRPPKRSSIFPCTLP